MKPVTKKKCYQRDMEAGGLEVDAMEAKTELSNPLMRDGHRAALRLSSRMTEPARQSQPLKGNRSDV